MTKAQYQRLKKLIKLANKEVENEALEEGVDITSVEFEQVLLKVKQVVIEKAGFKLEEYENEEKEPAKQEKEEFNKKLISLEKNLKEFIGKKINWEDIENKPKIPTEEDFKKLVPKIPEQKDYIPEIKRVEEKIDSIKIPEQIDNIEQIENLKWQLGEDIEEVKKLIPKQKNWTSELKKLQKDLQKYIDRTMPVPRGRVSDKGGRFYNWGMPDKGSYGTAIPDSRYYKKSEVDALIAVENLWDKSGTTLQPHTAGDDVLTTGRVDGSNIISGVGINKLTV